MKCFLAGAVICFGFVARAGGAELGDSALTKLPTVHVAQFAGDRAAAIAYTFDDNLRDQYTVAVPMLNEAGFKGTFFVIAGKTAENPEEGMAKDRNLNLRKRWGGISWPELKEMTGQGHEIASHTWSHRGMRSLTADEVEAELARAGEAIQARVGVQPLTMAFPFNQSTPEVQRAALKHHVAYRSFQTGLSDKSTTASLNAWSDKLVLERRWGVLMAHGIASGYAALSDPRILREHFQHVKQQQAAIWVDTFANITRYQMERDDAKLKVSGTKGNLICLLSGTLDPQRYDVPLTLVVAATDARDAVATRAGRPLPVAVIRDAIHVQATPAADPISIRWQ